MINLLGYIVILGLAAQALIGLAYLISSIWEKEERASIFAGIQFLGMLGILILLIYWQASGFFGSGIGLFVLISFFVVGILTVFFCVRQTPVNQRALEGTKGLIVGKVERFDERKHVFARNRTLIPGSDPYKAFYTENPELEAGDAARRKKGGPMGHPGRVDRPHDGPNVAATLASLSICLWLSSLDKVKPQAHPECKGKTVEMSPEEATMRVKGFAKNRGAVLVGITEINPLWVFSHKGEIFHENWEDWGRSLEARHKYAIVFAEEMDFEMIGSAPHTPTVMESMGAYAKGAFIAAQLANFVANMGYSATADQLRYYEELLVPLAVDAGLGEAGRLGYILTKKYGPRVRLSAVTTNLPLVPDKPIDIGVEDFCRICKKCAVCCPSNSIPLDDQKEVNGTLRWKLNAETCFDYWGKVGTDCNVCMKVCPWSHANTMPHQLIKWMVSRNSISRRLFAVMDDIFYGKRPKARPAPKWAQFKAFNMK
jgi:reductive dehalogenase